MLNSNGQRELVYSVRVNAVEPMIGYDSLELATINGWHCVVGKDSMKAGDLAIYFEIDSKLPEIAPFCDSPAIVKYKYKIKTQKFGRGGVKYLSQGLLMPLSDFPNLKNVEEGQFLTEQLGVTYYEAEDNARKADYSKYTSMKARHKKFFKTKLGKWLMKREWGRKLCFFFLGKKKDKKTGSFPTHFPYIHKSDEERVENMPWILENKEPWLKTLKIDGTSSTYILERLKGKNKFEFYVLSRNVRQQTPDQKCYHESNVYWEVENKFHIKDMLLDLLNKHPEWSYVCIQGESAGIGASGSKIQGNPHNFNELRFFGFNFIDSIKGRWESTDAQELVANYGIEWVPIIDKNYILPDTMEEFKKSAEGNCEAPGAQGLREGYVYRKVGEPTLSFKNINNEYLLGQK